MSETPDTPQKTEEEMLAEWQDMAAEDGGDSVASSDADEMDMAAAMGQSGKVLDQSEIDSLLGVDSEEDSGGIKALVNTSIVNYEKLPMLDRVFDEFERYLSTSLRHFTADNVEVTVLGTRSVRFGDYLNSIPLPAGIVVVNATGLDDYILTVFESKMVYGVVEVLLGGRKSRAAAVENRTFTNIERGLINNLTEIILKDLSKAFEPIAPINFKAERMEVNPRFAVISRENNAAVLVTIRVSLEEREGEMQFCMPLATLEPIRDQLLQQFMGEKFGQDNIWENHLAQELFHTGVPVSAVLDEFNMPLSQVLDWRLGGTVMLEAKPNSTIYMKCGNITKLSGNMGKVGDKKAVMIQQNISDINNASEEG